jgi:formate hydrogenlyase subunit 3/multisubunit Na+/H+ antiporter MnhD subunit
VTLILVLCCVGVLLGLPVAAVAAGCGAAARRLVYGASLVAAVVGLCQALVGLAGSVQTAPAVTLPLGLPWLGAHFRLDPISAFFLAIVTLGGAAASLYGIGYGRHESAPQRVLPFYPAFLAGMVLVVIADDAFTFLASWEFMSLTSWALVMADHRADDTRRAGYVYLVMATLGMLSLLLAFGLLAGPGGAYAFAAMRGHAHSAAVTALILALALFGAGSKAGIVPLHVWLPLAHPAAPSHVSAMMSGVMTKIAVYAFVRIVFDLLGPPAWWWSMPVLILGGITAVLGVLYALMQHDLKRLLAYHTVENIGIIFIGLGLALAFRANANGGAAALALTAALFHVFNHSLFKGLLFFGAGAVLTATGERDMERLGGLIHRMPVTSFTVLVGCAAISALPPLNGFVSEWLTFQAILKSPGLAEWGLKLTVPVVGALLALSAALAAACFVKAFGVTFLSRPRTSEASQAGEVDRFSQAAMAIFAALCLLGGILPGLVVDGLAPAVGELVGDRLPVQSDLPWLTIIPITAGQSSYNGLLVFLFIGVSAWAAVFAIHRWASHVVRRAPAWDCGFPDADPATQYTAASFAQPIRRVYGTLVFRARERVDMPQPGQLLPARFHLDLRDLIWDFGYAPIAGAVGAVADRVNRMQFLTIRRYLSLVFVALVLLLLILAIWL